MKIQRSSEDYMEAMRMLKLSRGYIRSSDVADQLKVTRPSVSSAVHRLKENGYLTMDEASLIELTDSGMRIASSVYRRHRVLTRIFEAMGVTPETARADACKIEHDISEETFDALCRCADRFAPETPDSIKQGEDS